MLVDGLDDVSLSVVNSKKTLNVFNTFKKAVQLQKATDHFTTVVSPAIETTILSELSEVSVDSFVEELLIAAEIKMESDTIDTGITYNTASIKVTPIIVQYDRIVYLETIALDVRQPAVIWDYKSVPPTLDGLYYGTYQRTMVFSDSSNVSMVENKQPLIKKTAIRSTSIGSWVDRLYFHISDITFPSRILFGLI